MDPLHTIVILVVTDEKGAISAVHWFDEGTFEQTKEHALKRALQWCESHRVDVDFMGRPPVIPFERGDWRMLIASGPPRVELFGQMKSL